MKRDNVLPERINLLEEDHKSIISCILQLNKRIDQVDTVMHLLDESIVELQANMESVKASIKLHDDEITEHIYGIDD